MPETLEEKIQRLYKYVHEGADTHHSNDLALEIQTELDNGKTIDNEYAKIFLKCFQELLKKASEPLYCKCDHEIGAHINFQAELMTGCSGISENHNCDCTAFRPRIR